LRIGITSPTSINPQSTCGFLPGEAPTPAASSKLSTVAQGTQFGSWRIVCAGTQTIQMDARSADPVHRADPGLRFWLISTFRRIGRGLPFASRAGLSGAVPYFHSPSPPPTVPCLRLQRFAKQTIGTNTYTSASSGGSPGSITDQYRSPQICTVFPWFQAWSFALLAKLQKYYRTGRQRLIRVCRLTS
jgi:hypothetical protein